MDVRTHNTSTKSDVRPLILRSLTAITCVVLSGCLTVSTRFVTGLSPEERALAAKLPVYEQRLAQGAYESKGQVSGLSCQVNQADGFRASEAGAMDELRRAAFKSGGTAVMGVHCESRGPGGAARGCFRSVECRGEAVKVDPDTAN